ncbi:hypothetical protein [Streptomyces sp. KLOTTS4A1]|uniref:hypothetical protein n=1 Tax=Streptomyces sp. KLOTTS4A1 TaxID=3390996 RepID=UPI0039F5A707
MSHVAAGGHLPHAGVLALLFGVLTVQGVVLFGGRRRRRRFDVTVLLLACTQFALHLALHRLSVPESGAHTASGHAAVGHGAHHMGGPHTADTADMAGHSMSTAMTLAHSAATLGAALCVVHGERVLRRLAALVVPDICRRPAVVLPVAPRPFRTPAPALHVGRGVLLARSCPRRGPPVPRAPA